MADAGGMRTVLSALTVIEAISDAQPVGVAELARIVDLPKSTVQRTLRSLWIAGWIHPDDSPVTKWVLSPRIKHIGERVTGDAGVRSAAIAVMHELRDLTGETVNLMVREGNRAVLIETVETSHPLRPVRSIGTSVPLHGSSNGKAMLSTMSHDEVRTTVGELEQLTEKTITGWDEFFADLDTAATRGYATNDGEWHADISAVAAPIRDRNGEAVASLSVSTPRSRMGDDAWGQHGQMVSAAAARISSILGYRPVD